MKKTLSPKSKPKLDQRKDQQQLSIHRAEAADFEQGKEGKDGENWRRISLKTFANAFFLFIVLLKNMKALDYILIWTQNTMYRPAFYYLQVLWSQNISKMLILIWNNAPKKSLLLTNVSLIFALFLVSTSPFSSIIITNKPPTLCYVAEYEICIKSCQSQLKKENHMIKFWSANS